MTARILGGRALAQEKIAVVRDEAKQRAARRGRAPLLCALAVDPDPGERSYLGIQSRVARQAGIVYRTEILDGGSVTEDVVRSVRSLCADPEVDGVFLSLPLPAHVDTEAALEALDPQRDADAIGRTSLSRLMLSDRARKPATARAVLAILGEAGLRVAGSQVTLVGRGRTAGLPILLALMHAGATVTVVHRADPDLPARVRQAGILVTAVGQPGLIRAVDLKPGSVVVDVGTCEEGGILKGDVEPEAAEVCAAFTPVPGGVGPVTTAFLMQGTLEVMR